MVPSGTGTSAQNLILVASLLSAFGAISVLVAGQSCRAQQSRSGYYKSSDRWEAEVTGTVSSPADALPQDLTFECTDRSSRFRSFDGTCNHYYNSGAAFRPMSRLLEPAYDDGVQSPRRLGSDCQPLPSARAVSKAIHSTTSDQRGYTPMLAYWAQFLEHDIVSVPVASEPNQTTKCCGPDNTNPSTWTHKDCMPIELEGDPDFAGSCMEFMRSMSSDELNANQAGSREPRQQLNSVTSFIDGSQIYGSSEAKATELRNGHLLKAKVVNGEEFPPELTGPKADSCIKTAESDDYCLDTGDGRGNENPGLAALHVLFLREHNRVARALQARQPRASPSDIFQESRTIVTAMIQKITYVDLLPTILGKDVNFYGLMSHKGSNKYNPNVDASVPNAFATVALKTFQSQIPDKFPVGDSPLSLATVFNSPGLAIDSLDDVLQGMSGGSKDLSRDVRPRAEILDTNFAEALTEHYYEPQGKNGLGLDRFALNIQRGRDHGIPSYNKWREYCNLRPLTGFDSEALGPNASEFGKLYSHVDDIDLFPALLSEPPTNGEGGPTLDCLLITGFHNLKYGDRFFYTNDGQVSSFTDAQRESIRQTSLAHIICQNTNIEDVPADVFRLPSRRNPTTSCETLNAGGLDLSLFVDSPPPPSQKLA